MIVVEAQLREVLVVLVLDCGSSLLVLACVSKGHAVHSIARTDRHLGRRANRHELAHNTTKSRSMPRLAIQFPYAKGRPAMIASGGTAVAPTIHAQLMTHTGRCAADSGYRANSNFQDSL